jgi:hypothetical protein
VSFRIKAYRAARDWARLHDHDQPDDRMIDAAINAIAIEQFKAGLVITIADRRQAAREAFQDAILSNPVHYAVDHAIETATRVRITAEVIAAGESAADRFFSGPIQRHAIIEAAFVAAGFEVEA